jgi:hypothetical protein
MRVIFKKRKSGSSGNPCDVAITVSPYRKGSDIDCLAIRLSARTLKMAGWQVGDRCIPEYEDGVWTLSRTTSRQEGYCLSQSIKSKTSTANVKLSLEKGQQIAIGMRRGDRKECDVTEASGEKIVAVVRS